MTDNPLPEMNHEHQDAADRQPVHMTTAVETLNALRADIEARYQKGLVDTAQMNQVLQAINTIIDVFDLMS